MTDNRYDANKVGLRFLFRPIDIIDNRYNLKLQQLSFYYTTENNFVNVLSRKNSDNTRQKN